MVILSKTLSKPKNYVTLNNKALQKDPNKAAPYTSSIYIILQRKPSCLTCLTVNYKVGWHLYQWHQQTETETDGLCFSTPLSPHVDVSNCRYMDSMSRIDGAGGWRCLTVHTGKIYFYRWSNKSKGKVWWWCKQRTVAHLFHRYWQMPER